MMYGDEEDEQGERKNMLENFMAKDRLMKETFTFVLSHTYCTHMKENPPVYASPIINICSHGFGAVVRGQKGTQK